ncbi:MAG TPA: flagellar basal body rod C-terminal domain-containing protein [Alphaproteobacteria bacterium]|jgi:flagellar basal-body rod protein FlgC|nr:flagellar basal body rod C-terminal domain-containing protein [Alphaproteobacteria bacterium]
MTDVLSIALSGLNAQKQRLDATASNVANATTTGKVPGTDSSAPASTVYKPLNVSLTALEGGGVAATTTADENGYSIVYDPSSPFANSDGEVAAPNVDFIKEMVSLLETKAAFKANLAVIRTQDDMTGELLDTIA